jgi:hypothetical protein
MKLIYHNMVNFQALAILQFRNLKLIYCIMKSMAYPLGITHQLQQIPPSKKLALSSEKYAFPLGNGNFLQ